MGPFKLDPKPPKEIAQIGTQIEKSAAEAAEQKGEVLPQDDEKLLAAEAKKENPKLDPSKPPKVVTATEPTELVVFDGEPDYTPLVEGEILYVSNTANDVLMEVASQQHYLLISGRWYRSKAWSGPWTYVRGDQLPATFKKIPEDSVKGHLLASVAGTPQAEEALADAQIPQVAEVRRGTAQLDIQYDGEPQFEKIKGTSIEYAKNTPNQILKIEGKYYACEQGIWYVSDGAKGPWQVADKVPEEVQKIPPDSPAYNTKYVYVYDSTPEVVYVGYTQPYLGCYPYYGTVVWGTGYPYVPWVGAVYYPRPVTFGFHAHYNPYTGWSFGLSMGWSFGWGTISIGFWGGGGYYPPYWGPGGYYPAYRPPYYPVHHPPHYPGRPIAGPYDGRGSAANRPSQQPSGGGGASASQLPAGGTGGASASQQPAGGRSSNLYDRPANKDKVASTPDRSGSKLSTRPSQGGGKNNVFADEAGNVYRKGSGGQWEQRVGDGWQKTPQAGTRPSQGGGSGARPSNPSAGTRPSAGARPAAPSQSVQRDYNSRQRGSQRSSGYSGYGGSYGGGYRGGGGMRGGGGRR
jgi:hypothetical protein